MVAFQVYGFEAFQGIQQEYIDDLFGLLTAVDVITQVDDGFFAFVEFGVYFYFLVQTG